MSVCVFCGIDMAFGVSCTMKEFLDAGLEPYERIRYGDPREGWEKNGPMPPPDCRDCATPLGGLHHPGCTVERCSRCGDQAICCICTGET